MGVALLALLALLGAAVALTVAAGTRPSYDAYGWLDWGRMTLHGGLDTNAAPSWKPLPYAFTLVYGLLGRGPEMWLWMVTVTAFSLAGLGCAGLLARRLVGGCGAEPGAGTADGTGAGPGTATNPGARGARWWAGWIAAAVAVLGLLAVHDEYPYGFLHYVLSAQTDPMIVAGVLGGALAALRGSPRAAFGLLLLASLGRPEAWPLLLAGGAWLWRERPGSRWLVMSGLAVVGLLWFGVPALSSRSALVAADNAGASGFAPHGNALHRATTVLGRFVFEVPWAIWAAAGGMVALAVWRRDRATLGLAGAVLVWIVIEIAFGVHGWPALGRYMFEPSAVVVVLGAACVGRLLGGDALGPAGAGRRARDSGGTALALSLVGVCLVLGTVPSFVRAGRRERTDVLAQGSRTASLDALGRTVDRLGAPRLRRCGEVISDGLETQTALAFDVGENVDRVGYRFPQPGHPDNPIVVFLPRGRGWTVRVLRQRTAGCRSLARG